MIRIRPILLSILISSLLGLSASFAHSAPPCNDSDGDGSPSGKEYSEHHIVPLAQDGALGNDGHKPGSHQGFSLCEPGEEK
jgi:hypothetical protein